MKKRNMRRRISAIMLSCSMAFGMVQIPGGMVMTEVQAAETYDNATTDSSVADSIESQMEIGTMEISGGGFVSGIVTGKDVMYARTDVGGAYKYNYETKKWEQLLGFLDEADRGLLSVDAICVDPTDDDKVYMLCGCAYFSDAKTVIFRSEDGGATFEEVNVTSLIQVHGNGNGRQFGEAIAVDPDQPNILYCGGDTTGLIMSEDYGKSWKLVEGYSQLGLFKEEINWPTWTEHKVKTTDTKYEVANGIGTVAITDGKVYVGTSIKGEANVHVAEVGSNDFKVLSEDLPTEYLPSHINIDADGNLLISYVNGISFDGSAGAAYRYNVKTGELTDISPKAKESKVGIGSVVSDPTDANKLVATSCGLWWTQSWGENAPSCSGDLTFKSEDGGQTWTYMLPGEKTGWPESLATGYLQDGGHSWIRNKAIHWSGSIVLDPRNSSRFLVTSGNGVFACDDVWAEVPFAYFHADGIEEVVSLDATSTPDGTFYSAIGDYDGFKHTSTDEAVQYSPTMDTIAQNSSCGAIAYCPTNPKVMVRYSNEGNGAFYSMDGGDTWTELESNYSGGKAAIAQLDENTYRIFRTGAGRISYTDNFGASWSEATGTQGSSNLWVCVDEKNPQYVYAYGYYYNQYYVTDEPTIDDARYILMVSEDYGKTFTAETVCKYDQCDNAYRIAYLEEGKFVLAAGWNGAYLVTDYGKNVTKLDNVSYCKTIGYGAAEKEGNPYTLYMWGKPDAGDAEGVYRSTDAGTTWVAVNTGKTYGGTGNGNYIVGNMKEFGTFYMSTVGCGIVYGKLENGGTSGEEDATTTESIKTEDVTTTEKPTEATTAVAATTEAATELTTQAATTQEPTEAATTEAVTELTTQAATTQEPTEATTAVAATTEAATELTTQAATTQEPTEAVTTQAATELTTQEPTEATTAAAATTEAATEVVTTENNTQAATTEQNTTENTTVEESIESRMEVGTMGISGGGFVSGIVTGKEVMYARTDVGGAYKYNYETKKWEQLFEFLSEEDRGLLSVDSMCIDPNDDNTVYFLCGCAYFSDARTAIFRTRDGGKTFDEIDVTDLIQVHGNGNGRQFGEAIAVDPDNSNIIYCGGDTTGLIKSEDGGTTWKLVEGYSQLGLFKEEINWPTWTEHKVKTTGTEYYAANGIGNIAIADGKVYVGTSIQGEANVHVADITDDKFTVLSEELPTQYLPSRINVDADGNLLISYVNGITFDGTAGGAYRYNIKTGEVTDIAPKNSSGTSLGIGAVVSDKEDANRLIATTCGVWNGQLWNEDDWENDKVVWGDVIYRSEDGGETWRQMSPGATLGWEQPLQADYLQDGGRSWIRNKAIHWSGAIVLDPKDSNRFLVTSGNGVFACDNTWEDLPSIYFHADGIEEVVSLDATSTPDGTFYSVIGDYDGFKHLNKEESVQFSPTMDTIAQNSSCGAIAYCPTNPKVMVRYSEGGNGAFYSMDGGDTWTKLESNYSGGKAAIVQLDENTYRIFRTGAGKISYTDNFGASWSEATGTQGSSNLWVCVDEKNPQYVYAYGYYYNQYYVTDEPTIDDARYILMVSEDYGKTFTAETVCKYDQCDNAYRIAYLEEGKFVLAAGWNGAYLVTDYGKSVTKLENVSYCKTIGYGAAEKEGNPYTLYMWGKPDAGDTEGIYRSTDAGTTWVAVNTTKTYGGTGNGNYIVGDMKEFGTYYMSTVGCGIIYGKLKDSQSSGEEDIIPVQKIEVTKESVTLSPGESESLSVTISPVNATEKELIWSSSDESVVTVDEKGNLTAVSTGTAVITVTTKDGNKTAECTVTVTKEGTSESTEATTQEATTEEKPTEAVTTQEGTTGEKPTEAVTTQEATTGEKTTETVTTQQATTGEKPTEAVTTQQATTGEKPTESVTTQQATTGEKPTESVTTEGTIEEGTDKIAVTGVELSENAMDLLIGETGILTATISPATASNKNVTWESNNTKIVTVDANGKLTAKAEGIAIVTVLTADGAYTADCLVSVKKESAEKVAVSGVVLNTNTLSLKVGQEGVLSPTIVPENATDKTVVWKTGDASIAAVKDGKVIGVAEGTTTITVITNDGTFEATCMVTVKKNTEQEIAVGSISINKNEVYLKPGESEQLTATILPENATNKNYTWTSNKENIVNVDAKGKITGLAEGIAVIIATAEDGGSIAYCIVTVSDKEPEVEVESVVIDPITVNLTVGKSTELTATVSPAEASQKVVWSSSNAEVATVDSNGRVIAKKAGAAIIKATAEDGSKYAECLVNVSKETEETVDAKSIELNINTLSLTVGSDTLLQATIEPENATSKEVIWSTSNASVATVENGKVTAVAAGTAIITVTTADGKLRATCQVEVKQLQDSTIPVTGVTLSEQSVELTAGETKKLTATVSPSNATSKEVTFKSSSNEVVTVNDKGEVTAVAAGTAVVFVTTTDGGKTAYCIVTVKETDDGQKVAVDSVMITPTDVELKVGESKELTAEVLPVNATNKKITWSSSDDSILTVDQNGKITAVKTGKATVIVSTEDGGKHAFCNVVIQAKAGATENVAVTDITMDTKTITLALKKTKTLKAVVVPSNATNKEIRYTSSVPSVATVDQNGKVKAVKPGVTVITVKAGNIVKNVTIKVKPSKVTSLKKKTVSGNKVKLTWKKQKNVSGYKVYRYNAKTKKYKLCKSTKKNTVTLTKLKKNTTYKFKVRAYKKSGSTYVYGSYSKTIKVKVK